MTYRRKSAQERVADVKTYLAPLGGINDVDPLAAMGEQYAISLINWMPGNAALNARHGYREWVTNLGAPVRTIMPYNAMSGDFKLFASTDAGIFDVTVSTAAPVVAKAITNGYYKWTTFGNVANQYLVAVNVGTSPSVLYNGTTWVDFTQVVTPAAPGEISGVDPNLFSHVVAFKRRLWFVQEDTMTAWYLPVDATSGAATPFYLTSIFKRGGKLLYMASWSVSSGEGLDDKLLFVSSLGEIAVYAGNDPNITTDWALESLFFAGPPIGERSFAEVGGDIFIVTTSGLTPISRILNGMMDQAPSEQAVSKRISRTLNRIVASRLYASNWEVHNTPIFQAIWVVIPGVGVNPPIQFVMNSITGAWTRFDLPINCALSNRDMFYFGTTDGRVCIYGGESFLDDIKIDGSGGLPVQCSLFSAYNYMGDPGTLKHWKLLRPILQSDQPPSYLIGLRVDFDIASLAGNPAPPSEAQVNPLWDTALWDGAFWSSEFTVYRPWVGVAALGFCCALQLKVASNDETSFVAIEFVYEKGGAI